MGAIDNECESGSVPSANHDGVENLFQIAAEEDDLMARPGRPAGLPQTGGRKKGSLDRQARALITEKIAGDILATYQKLGGQEFLLEWAEANQTEFIRQCLTRFMPAPPKEAPDTVNNTQINVGTLDDMAIARRIAFVLSKAVHDQESLPHLPSG